MEKVSGFYRSATMVFEEIDNLLLSKYNKIIDI